MSGSKNRPGFTLLEVVAALALLGISLSVLYAGYLQAANLEAKAAETGLAISLARARLARVEAGEETGAQGQCDGAPGFTWTLAREPFGETSLARLTVTVTWGREHVRSVKVWTLVGNGS